MLFRASTYNAEIKRPLCEIYYALIFGAPCLFYASPYKLLFVFVPFVLARLSPSQILFFFCPRFVSMLIVCGHTPSPRRSVAGGKQAFLEARRGVIRGQANRRFRKLGAFIKLVDGSKLLNPLAFDSSLYYLICNWQCIFNEVIIILLRCLATKAPSTLPLSHWVILLESSPTFCFRDKAGSPSVARPRPEEKERRERQSN